MKLTVSQLKKASVGLFVLPALIALMFTPVSVKTRAADDPQDAAAVYTAQKCAVCHGAKAEKRFNAALPETEMIDAVLKGKKGEKPPNMPSYEAKGVTADQAKALVTYMKSLQP